MWLLIMTVYFSGAGTKQVVTVPNFASYEACNKAYKEVSAVVTVVQPGVGSDGYVNSGKCVYIGPKG